MIHLNAVTKLKTMAIDILPVLNREADDQFCHHMVTSPFLLSEFFYT